MRKPILLLTDKQFQKYFLIGIASIILSTFLLWILVDILLLNAFISNLLVSAALFFGKFSSYKRLGMFKRGGVLIAKYLGIHIFVVLFASFLLWVFVDVFLLSVVFVNPFVVGVAFLFRFQLFELARMIERA